jgi:hypothetical protein
VFLFKLFSIPFDLELELVPEHIFNFMMPWNGEETPKVIRDFFTCVGLLIYWRTYGNTAA